MKVFIALACLATVASAGLVTKKSLAARTTCGPDEVECPDGCCPYTGWYCCPDNRNCAATADDCPDIRLPNLLPKKLSVVKTTCGSDETDCFVGCCPHANWFCCPDGRYCAATADYCPAKKIPTPVPKKLSVVKTSCGPEQIECPAGCCDLG